MGRLLGLDAGRRAARQAARPGGRVRQHAAPRSGAIRAPLLYDADCGFCRWCLGQVLRLDRHGRLRPVALQSPEAGVLLAGMPEEERMASWHLVGKDGRVHSGGDAFAPLLRLLPGGAQLARAPAAFPSAADVAYRFVAERRSAFGRLIPDTSAARARDRIEAAERAGPTDVV